MNERIAQFVEVTGASTEQARYAALERWAEAVEGVYTAVTQKTSVGGRGETSLMNAPEAFAGPF